MNPRDLLAATRFGMPPLAADGHRRDPAWRNKDPHGALWISDHAHNASRTNGLSKQQGRDQRKDDRGKHNDSRNQTIGEIEIQNHEPRTRSIHRTFLNR